MSGSPDWIGVTVIGDSYEVMRHAGDTQRFRHRRRSVAFAEAEVSITIGDWCPGRPPEGFWAAP